MRTGSQTSVKTHPVSTEAFARELKITLGLRSILASAQKDSMDITVNSMKSLTSAAVLLAKMEQLAFLLKTAICVPAPLALRDEIAKSTSTTVPATLARMAELASISSVTTPVSAPMALSESTAKTTTMTARMNPALTVAPA